jgi:hypothetical protein
MVANGEQRAALTVPADARKATSFKPGVDRIAVGKQFLGPAYVEEKLLSRNTKEQIGEGARGGLRNDNNSNLTVADCNCSCSKSLCSDGKSLRTSLPKLRYTNRT